MRIWFEVKAKYLKMLETGAEKIVYETYLIEAVSFTDAEAKATKELEKFMIGEFEISAVGKKRFSDCFFTFKGDIYYKVRLYFITLDERSGKKKKLATNMLVQASNLEEAVSIVMEEMEKSIIDYSIESVTETAIIDVFMDKEE
jgi:hypothetical protein